MKKSLLLLVAVASVVVAFAQGQMGQNPNPEYVAFAKRWYNSAQDVGRSHNNAPTFFVYPDTKVDEAGAQALLEELGMLSTAEANQSAVYVLNPVGEKYDAKADFGAFVEMFNRARSGNLKVVGVGAGATFVNSALAMTDAASHIAGILTIGGKAQKDRFSTSFQLQSRIFEAPR